MDLPLNFIEPVVDIRLLHRVGFRRCFDSVLYRGSFPLKTGDVPA